MYLLPAALILFLGDGALAGERSGPRAGRAALQLDLRPFLRDPEEGVGYRIGFHEPGIGIALPLEAERLQLAGVAVMEIRAVQAQIHPLGVVRAVLVHIIKLLVAEQLDDGLAVRAAERHGRDARARRVDEVPVDTVLQPPPVRDKDVGRFGASGIVHRRLMGIIQTRGLAGIDPRIGAARFGLAAGGRLPAAAAGPGGSRVPVDDRIVAQVLFFLRNRFQLLIVLSFADRLPLRGVEAVVRNGEVRPLLRVLSYSTPSVTDTPPFFASR